MMDSPQSTDSGIVKPMNRAIKIGRWALTAALLIIIVWLIVTQDRDALEGLKLNWMALLLASWLLLLYTILISERFRMLVCIRGSAVLTDTIMFLRSLAISRVLNGIVPQSGNVYRGQQLKETIGLRWSEYLTVSLAGTAIDLVCLIAVGALLALLHAFLPLHDGFLSSQNWATMILTASLLTIIACITMAGCRNYLKTSIQYTSSSDATSAGLARYLILIFTHKSIIYLTLQTFSAFALLAAVIWLILFSMQLDGGLITATILMALTRASQYLSITPGNLGVRELMYAFAGNQLAIGMGTAVLVSIILRVMNWLVIALVILSATLVRLNQKGSH